MIDCHKNCPHGMLFAEVHADRIDNECHHCLLPRLRKAEATIAKQREFIEDAKTFHADMGKMVEKTRVENKRLKKEISIHASVLCDVTNGASMAIDDVDYWLDDTHDENYGENIAEVLRVVKEYRDGEYNRKSAKMDKGH